MIRVTDKMGKDEEEARKLAEDTAYLSEVARQNRLMEKLDKALE
jgi:hypothetical protein